MSVCFVVEKRKISLFCVCNLRFEKKCTAVKRGREREKKRGRELLEEMKYSFVIRGRAREKEREKKRAKERERNPYFSLTKYSDSLSSSFSFFTFAPFVLLA